MRKRPTLASLRAGQTLYIVDLTRSLDTSTLCLNHTQVTNIGRRALRKFPHVWPWSMTFYSRRQALRHCQRLLDLRHAHFRDLRGIEFPGEVPLMPAALVRAFGDKLRADRINAGVFG